MEFNYLKALIGFLVLIAGPAMLVGIAPSIALTLGLMKFNTAASAEYSPIVAVGVLLLAAVATGPDSIRIRRLVERAVARAGVLNRH